MISRLIEALQLCTEDSSSSVEYDIILNYLYNFINDGFVVPEITDLLVLGEEGIIPLLDGIPTLEDTVKDFRFQRLLVNGVRKFPYQDGQYYGLDFTKDGAVVSSIYLGSNGVGKSSLYAAMERASLHRLYSAEARGCVSQDEQDKYFHHVGDTDHADVIIQTLRGEIYYPSDQFPFSYPAFFCSDYDIKRMESKDFDEEDIDIQLGLSATKKILNNLEGFQKLVGNFIELHKLEADNPENIDEIQICQNNIISVIGEGFNLEGYNFSPDFHSQCQQLIQNLKVFYELWIEEFKQKMKTIVPELMSAYLDTEKEKINLVENEDSFKLQLLVRSDNNHDWTATSPRIYLNTFRFKVYCVVLKIALACCVKQMGKFNFPIVIDDVFDSVDFNHRYKIHELIQKIVEKHNKVMYDERLGNIPDNMYLQLIFLTQDNLVGENIWRGITKASDPAKYSRIYRCEQYRDEDVKEIQVSNPTNRNIKFIKLEDSILN